jgi:DtxR family Mn-dependent transcriptional regulator
MPTSTIEDYLKTIYLEQLSEPGRRVATGRIAELLSVAPGTVTSMLKTLGASRLVRYEPYSGVELTESGIQLASHVLRRHRLVEQFLVEVMGMNWSEVHEEAETLEHAISDRLLVRMDEMLGFPEFDPHGDPIPTESGAVAETDFPSLLACPLDTTIRVARVLDQGETFLRLLERNGVLPGRHITVVAREEDADAVTIRSDDGRTFSLGFRTASKVLVEPIGT